MRAKVIAITRYQAFPSTTFLRYYRQTPKVYNNNT